MFLAVFLVTACTKSGIEKPVPIELTREHSCAVCGMIIVDFPGTKAQIHYRNGRSDMFCSTLDMLMFYLQPDRPGHITAIYVQDMGKADWDHPEGHWIDAEEALYVYGGDIMGPMGDALVSFSDVKDTEVYMNDHEGRIVRFNDINMAMLRPDVQISR